MHRVAPLFVLLAALASGRPADAADRVRLVNGGAKSGRVLESSRESVAVETVDGVVDVPAAQVRSVLFEEEPPQLTQARINAGNGGYETALGLLAEARTAGEAGLVAAEIDFYTALCETRLAIVGERKPQDAGRLLKAFVGKHGDSFHYYEAVGALGDLLVSMGRHDRAERTYAEIAKSPSIALKARSALLIGLSLQSRGEHADALKRFDALLAARTDAPGVAVSQHEARLAKAVSLAASGDLAGGLEAARRAVRSAGDDDAALAAGYNTLGRCYEAAGKPKDALFAYLHTDLLFSGDPATHSEALGRLAELWRSVGKPDAARDAAVRLRRQYASSPAARSAG